MIFSPINPRSENHGLILEVSRFPRYISFHFMSLIFGMVAEQDDPQSGAGVCGGEGDMSQMFLFFCRAR